ncbi:MAG: hypothetical protein ACPLZG_13030 [Thermoproteota archaeon]
MAKNQDDVDKGLFECFRKIQEVSEKMTENLRKSSEQYQELGKEVLSAMLLTVLTATLLNLFSARLQVISWVCTPGSIPPGALPPD